MESKIWITQLKEKGSGILQAAKGQPMKWTLLRSFQGTQRNGIFLLHDLFQLRSIAPPFSDVSLDIIDWAEDPVIFHTTVSPFLKNGPISEGIIKFALIKEQFWNKMLYASGQIIVSQEVIEEHGELTLPETFPLQRRNVKEMFLSAEGQVKIIKP